MDCETRHVHEIDCLGRVDDGCCLESGHNMLLYFMGDFGRARLWTGAMKLAHLAPQLKALETAVVLVGEVAEGAENRLGAAARLAEELALPFPLVADSQRSLWRRYGAPRPGRKRAGLMLVNGCGCRVGCCAVARRRYSGPRSSSRPGTWSPTPSPP